MKRKTIAILVFVCVVVITVLALAPLTGRGAEGYLVLENAGATVRLSGGLFSNVTLGGGTEPRKVPAREYVPKWLTVTAENGSGIWRLQSVGPWGELSKVTVEKDKTTVVKLGPPLEIRPQTNVNDSYVSAGLTIFGRAGERYRTVMTVNGSPMPEPKVKIIDQDGNVLASGRFKYG